MRLESIQVLRGAAALLVFVFHLVVTVDRYSPADLALWVEFGQFGVDLFFVISGFVMAYSVREMSGPRDTTAFLAARAWRIAPLLYILAAAQVFLSTLRGQAFDIAQLVNCLTILPVMESPSRFQYALIPAWTLGFELAFYFLVAAAVAVSRHALLAAVPILFLSLLPGNGPIGSSLMIEFIFGLLAYVLWTRGVIGKPLLFTAAAALALAFPLSEARFIAWGLPAALLFCAVLAWQPGNRILEQNAKWLGTISYSLYLSHVVTFDAMAPLFAPLGLLPLALSLGCLGVVVAWLVYETVEAPLWRLRKRGSAEVGTADLAVEAKG